MSSVLIADDHAIVRAGLRGYLQEDRSVKRVGESASGCPNTKVLVMSGFPEKIYAISLLMHGASGYVSKDQAPAEILRAVHMVLAGRRFVSAALSEMLVEALDEPSDQPVHANLSQRELQVFCKLAIGRNVSEIARELILSVKTVSTYRARVLEKMNLLTNPDLTTYPCRRFEFGAIDNACRHAW